MYEDITFSGQEAQPLDLANIQEAISLIDVTKPVLHHILQNCTEEQLETVFGEKQEGTAKDILYGCPIYQKWYIPKGELWMIDQNGKVIQKFKC